MFVCDYCGKGCKSQNGLSQHISRTENCKKAQLKSAGCKSRETRLPPANDGVDDDFSDSSGSEAEEEDNEKDAEIAKLKRQVVALTKSKSDKDDRAWHMLKKRTY